jgi:AcrR family transcriptional regulator
LSTKEKILNGSRVLFNREGWREVRIRDIAGSLGISPGNLTYHFPKKEDLLKAILAQLWVSERTAYQSFLEQNADTGGLLHVIQRVFRDQLDNHGILAARYLYYDEMNDEGKSIESAQRDIFSAAIRQLADAGQLHVNEEDTSFLVAFLLLFTRSWIADHSLDGEGDIHRYLYLLAQQFYYFASEEGMASINAFLDTL